MNKYLYRNQTTYYQKARFFRNKSTNEFAYCIQPFEFFNEDSTYTPTNNPDNLSQKKIELIKKIAHFGYGYKDHQDSKWYAITQLMIWQAADGSNGKFYFSNTLNGEETNLYENEINEINSLINNYDNLPSVANKEYSIVEGHSLKINDDNNSISYYKTEDNISIEGNTLIFNNSKKGEYNFTFKREENIYNKPTIFYQTKTGQNLMEYGDLENKEITFKIKVYNTKIDITKIDKDTKGIIPSGEGVLDGTKFALLNSNKEKINELEIKNNIIIINNINFGKYYIQEITPGIGYNINDNIYEINISEDNPIQELIIENEIIKKKIKIEKKYGENNTFISEKNIDFEVYNSKGELIKTISTDESGTVEIELPYGTYKFVQINSTTGYSKVDPFEISITDNKEEIIELKDYKIPVPNTHINKNNNIINSIFNLIINIFNTILW